MTKKRIHELARELNIESKEIIQRLNQMGITVKSHMSTLEDSEIENLLQHLGKKPAEEKNGGSKGTVVEVGSPGEDRKAPSEGEKEPVGEAAARATARSGFSGRGKKRGGRNGRGPGLVDRVPSRPPDRRFTDRTLQQAARPDMKREKRGKLPSSEPRTAGASQPARVPQAKNRENAEKRGFKPLPEKSEPQVIVRATDAAQVSPRAEAAVKLKALEKAKPDQAKIQERVKAAERARQFEKHSFKDAVRGGRGRHLDRQRDYLLDEEEEERLTQALHKGKASARAKSATKQEEPASVAVKEKKPIVIPETLTVQELAQKMGVSPVEVIKKLMDLGMMVAQNQEVDSDVATIVASDFGYEVEVKVEPDEEALLMQEEEEEDPANLLPRPCVVTVLGHVDHGKTSLLDAIRHTNVTATEAGGITQHIGAYQVEHEGKKITFIDTPGHEAFTAMRARGARVTDIAVLVVAADDGVMPQTVEALNHARAAGVPIIVAINKIDKPEADPERVKRQLTEHGLVPEKWGGDTIFVEVSAIQKKGIDELLEMILLVAEMNELKANPNRPARGTVIESKLDKGRGPVATVLVQNGTLKVGDALVAGTAFCKVRAMQDFTGKRLSKAGPSTPVEVLGFSEVPPAGETFVVVEDEKKAKQIVARRIENKREEEMKAAVPKVSLDDFFRQVQEGHVKELKLIVKADVQGSVEALKQALENLSTEEVKVNIIHSGVGAVSETDIMLASASNAIVIGFNVRPDVNARRAAESEKVDIRLYRIIYEVIDDVKAALSGLLEPEYREIILGRAEVRKIFKISKVGTVAGCYVLEGKITRDAKVRLIRDGVVVYEGKLESLKRFKDDVREVVQGYECGLALEKYNEIKEGDQIEAFTVEAVKRELA